MIWHHPTLVHVPLGEPNMSAEPQGCDHADEAQRREQESWLCPFEEFGVHVWVVHSIG
jgi:hypothetical protein